MSVRPERLAAAARALQRALLEHLALRADELGQQLATEEGMVPWDREQLLGRVQRDLQGLRERRFASLGGDPVRVRERHRQPLECIVTAWEQLRRGRRVAVEIEPGASTAGVDVLERMAQVLGAEWLLVSARDRPLPADARAWPEVGVARALSRVGHVQADADPELAAYLLARACLRRTGFDPRGVHHAVIVGPAHRLHQHLRRLWVGARMGPPTDPSSFAGPVSEEKALQFEQDLERLRAADSVEVLVPGDRLDRAGVDGVCLAPALLATKGEGPGGATPRGPILVLHETDAASAKQLLETLAPRGHGRIWVGQAPRGRELGPDDRQYAGALLLERIPPGLPKPRP